jgi:hypothetical protein
VASITSGPPLSRYEKLISESIWVFTHCSFQYFAKDSDHVVLAHVVQVQNDQSDEWYEAFVDANTGEVVNVVSFVADASVSDNDLKGTAYTHQKRAVSRSTIQLSKSR